MSTKEKYHPIPKWVNQGALYHSRPRRRKKKISKWKIFFTVLNAAFNTVIGCALVLLVLLWASTLK